MKDHLAEFIRLFNETQFYDAHEILEELWVKSEPPVKGFYRGLIQCAVAFAHWQRGNLRGALALFERSKSNLHLYPDVYLNIHVAKLLGRCEEFFAGDINAVGAPYFPIPGLSSESHNQ